MRKSGVMVAAVVVMLALMSNEGNAKEAQNRGLFNENLGDCFSCTPEKCDDLTLDCLPDSVQRAFKYSIYGSWTVVKVSIEEGDKGLVEYRIEVKKFEERNRLLIYNSEGKLLKNLELKKRR
ncbi:hypothetical protein [Alistipes sp. ZOR0009]|uniref:hypothetical protein n=1 Tax=Alistipes sp. ZOR0009 TaxID=1339253 RepID=UPI00064622E0|nr:hypothetical protein [Alistipes sp. ZOR0009]